MSNADHKIKTWLKRGCCLASLFSLGMHAQSVSQNTANKPNQESPESLTSGKKWMDFNASLEGMPLEERIRRVDRWLNNESGLLKEVPKGSLTNQGVAQGSVPALLVSSTNSDIPSDKVLTVHLQDKAPALKIREIDQVLAEDKKYQEAQSKLIAQRAKLPDKRASLEDEIRKTDLEIAKKQSK